MVCGGEPMLDKGDCALLRRLDDIALNCFLMMLNEEGARAALEVLRGFADEPYKTFPGEEET